MGVAARLVHRQLARQALAEAELIALHEVDAAGVRYLEFFSGVQRMRALSGMASVRAA